MIDLYTMKKRVSYMIPHKIRNVWDSIRFWLNPRQKWLTKKIPNHWADKDRLWEICILEGIKHHVEQDGGLDGYVSGQSDPEYPEYQKSFDREIMENYRLVTEELPLLEYRLEKALDKIPKFDFKNPSARDKRSYEEIYGDSDKYEKEIVALKTKVMVWAVTNRESIWT